MRLTLNEVIEGALEVTAHRCPEGLERIFHICPSKEKQAYSAFHYLSRRMMDERNEVEETKRKAEDAIRVCIGIVRKYGDDAESELRTQLKLEF